MPYYQWTAVNANVQYVQISPLVQQTVKFTHMVLEQTP